MKTFSTSTSLIAVLIITLVKFAPTAEGTSEPDLFLPQRETLERSKALWNSQPGKTNYQFQYEKIGSQDVPNTVYPWTITIAGGQRSARDANNNPVSKMIPPSIDSIFMVIETQLDLRQVTQMDVQYNPQYGYPERVYLVLNPGGIYDVEITNLKFNNNNLPTTTNPPQLKSTTTPPLIVTTISPGIIQTPKGNNNFKKQELAQAALLWSSSNIRNYSYRYQESTGNSLTRANVKNFPWTVTVAQNYYGAQPTVTVTDVYGTLILDTTGTFTASGYAMEDLFAKIDNAFRVEDSIPSTQVYKSIDAQYNPVYGFPEDINIVSNTAAGPGSSGSSLSSYQATILSFQPIN